MAQEQAGTAHDYRRQKLGRARSDSVWAGSLFEGSGKVSARVEHSPSSRSPGRRGPSTPTGKTSPEELLAAAHAGCFSMAFSLVLAEADRPEQLSVNATCAFEQVPDGFAITTIDLDVHGRVPGSTTGASNRPRTGRTRLSGLEGAEGKRRDQIDRPARAMTIDMASTDSRIWR